MSDSQAGKHEDYELIKTPNLLFWKYVGFFCVSALAIAFAATSERDGYTAVLAFVAASVSIFNGMMIIKALKALQQRLSSIEAGRDHRE